MAVDFKTFVNVVDHVVSVKKPCLLRGRHGIGKSTVVYQFAEKSNLRVVERRASQMTEGDLCGLPSIEGNSTRFNPPDWFKDACDNPVLLFLDEVDRATLEVRQGIFELTDSRKLNGHVLHPDTIVFAAVNGGEHGDQYQVGEMDPAELDRWTVFDVEPSIEDWLTWASGKIDGVIWDFINTDRTHLEHTGDYEPNKVYPSRRSWERLNECLSSAGLLEGASPTLFTLANAFVGFEAAVAFNEFVTSYDRQVTVEDILVKGDFSKVENWSVIDFTAMVSKLEESGRFKEVLPEKQIKNLARFFMKAPSESSMSLWTVIGAGDTQNIINLHKVSVDGQSVSNYIVEMLTGDTKD